MYTLYVSVTAIIWLKYSLYYVKHQIINQYIKKCYIHVYGKNYENVYVCVSEKIKPWIAARKLHQTEPKWQRV